MVAAWGGDEQGGGGSQLWLRSVLKRPPRLGRGPHSEYLDTVSLIILESGGVVDKYIGDIAMAFWNAPLPVRDHKKVACRVALNSQKKLQFLAKGTFSNARTQNQVPPRRTLTARAHPSSPPARTHPHPPARAQQPEEAAILGQGYVFKRANAKSKCRQGAPTSPSARAHPHPRPALALTRRPALTLTPGPRPTSTDWRMRGYPHIRSRMALHTGTALVGNLGAPERLNYTCIGAWRRGVSRGAPTLPY